MRRPGPPLFLALLATLVASACQRHPSARAPEDAGQPLQPVAWTARSAGGKATVQQRGEGGRCVLEGAGAGRTWSAGVCAATREQLTFVSEDGQWLLVIDPLPPVREGRWQEADAVSLFLRGQLRVRAPVGDFVQSPRDLHFFIDAVGWLQGTADLEGTPPRYGPDGTTVRGELADGSPFSLPFDDTPRERPRPPAPTATAPALRPPESPKPPVSPGPPPDRPALPAARPPRARPPMRVSLDLGVAWDHANAGRVSSAVEELERLRSAVHHDAAGLRELANAEGSFAIYLLQVGNPDEARRFATIGVETDAAAPRPREALGRISYSRNDVPEAMSEWSRGLAENPDDVSLKTLVAKGQVELASLKSYRTRSSDHFVLTFEEGREDRELAELTLSILEEAHQKVTAVYAFRPADKVPVVIYPNETFSRLEGRARWAAGMFDGKVRVGCSGAMSHQRDFRSLLAHEYGHAVLHRATRGADVPGWFHEGTSEVAEGALEPRVPVTCAFGHGARLKDLRGPFAVLPGSVKQIHHSYFAANHAVERMIARWGPDSVRELIRRVGQGEPFDQAFEGVTRQSHTSFVEAFDRQDPGH